MYLIWNVEIRRGLNLGAGVLLVWRATFGADVQCVELCLSSALGIFNPALKSCGVNLIPNVEIGRGFNLRSGLVFTCSWGNS
jgi:hypothetical protein